MQTESGRPLGQIETSMALLHQLHGSTQTTSLLTFSGYLRADQLQQAAAALHARHPLLHSRIVERDEGLHFCPDVAFSQIDLQCLAQPAGVSPSMLLQQQLAKVLDPSRQLWRLILLSSADACQHQLLLTCHHAIADAASLVQLLDELLADGERLLTQQPLDCALQPLAAPLDSHLLAASAPLPDCATPPLVDFFQAAPLEQRSTGVSRLLLATDLTAQLQRVAAQQQLSLNSLLAGALLKAAQGVGLGAQIRIATAVSLRERAARLVDRQAIGCFISVAHHCLTVSGRPWLSLAHDYQQQLRASLPALAQGPAALSLSTRRAQVEQLSSQQGFAHGIALTNHGNIVFSHRSHLQVTDYANAASRVAGNFAVAVHVSRFQGALSLCFTFPSPLLEQTRLQRLQSLLQQSLMALTPAHEVCP